MERFKSRPDFLEGKTCPFCGEEFSFCEVEGCEEFAIYEGWIKCGVMSQRRRVCKEHAKLTQGYIAKGEAIVKEVLNG